MKAPPILVVDRVSKTFPGQRALDDVSLSVGRGEVRALLGANGSGKSTLVKVLAGIHTPDRGSGGVAVDGAELHLPIAPAAARSAGLRFVHQELGLVDRRPVIENLTYGRKIRRTRFGLLDWEAERDAASVIMCEFGADFALDDLVGELSRAQQTMLAVMRAFEPDADGTATKVLVLDEPTVGLPPDDVMVVWRTAQAVAARGVGVLFVTHAIDEVEQECDAVTVLRDGRVVFDAVVESISGRDIVQAITGGAGLSSGEPLQIQPKADDTAQPALEVRALTTDRLAGVDLAVRPGEVLGVAGGLDSGMSDLLQVLYGDAPSTAARRRVAGVDIASADPLTMRRAGVAYVPSKRAAEACFAGLDLRENLTVGSLDPFCVRGRLLHHREDRAAAALVEEYGIIAPGLAAPIEALSGGNQQKAILARWFRTGPVVVLLDEPTQGIDIAAKVQIHGHIRQAASTGTAVIVTSSEVEELATLCDRVLVLERGRVVRELTGSITASDITQALFDTHVTARGAAT